MTQPTYDPNGLPPFGDYRRNFPTAPPVEEEDEKENDS